MAEGTVSKAPRRCLGGLVLGSAMLLAACSSDAPGIAAGSTTTSAPMPATSTTSSTTSSTAEAADPTPPADTPDGEVRVIGVGDLPRQNLSLTPTAGTQRMEVTTRNRVTAEAGGERRSASSSTIQTVEVEVAERADGRFDVRQEVLDVEVAEFSTGTRAKVERSAEAMIGMESTAVIDGTGQASDLDVRLPDDAPEEYAALVDQLRGTMEQLATPVPDEPIGVGGSWTTTQTIDLLGADVRTTVTFTLVSIDDQGATVRAVTEMDAAPDQEISVSGRSGTLDSFTSFGSSETLLRPGQFLSETKGRSTSKETLSVNGRTVQQEMRTSFELRPLS